MNFCCTFSNVSLIFLQEHHLYKEPPIDLSNVCGFLNEQTKNYSQKTSSSNEICSMGPEKHILSFLLQRTTSSSNKKTKTTALPNLLQKSISRTQAHQQQTNDAVGARRHDRRFYSTVQCSFFIREGRMEQQKEEVQHVGRVKVISGWRRRWARGWPEMCEKEEEIRHLVAALTPLLP